MHSPCDSFNLNFVSPVSVNGRALGVQQNGSFNESNTEPIPGGRLWADAAVTWLAMRADAANDGVKPNDFMPAGPNSSARSREAQDRFWRNQPPAAARPYSSNHGWGLAVDVKTRTAAAWMMQNAHRYGWSHDEGARVGEWWHFRYVGTTPKKLQKFKDNYGPDPLAVLTSAEREWCKEYDELRKRKKDEDRPRKVALRDAMTKRRKQIWRAAQEDGWEKLNRRGRFLQLAKRTSKEVKHL
jgi:hypothetical protein